MTQLLRTQVPTRTASLTEPVARTPKGIPKDVLDAARAVLRHHAARHDAMQATLLAMAPPPAQTD